MDENIRFVFEEKIKRVIKNLEENNINGYFVEDEKDAIEKIKEIIEEGDTVSVGGSMSLFETGIIDFLRKGNYNFLDRYEEGLTSNDIKELFIKTFSSDAYLVSTNAITEKGELYNVDGLGNRVAAMIYGPKKVIVVAGINKIVKDIDEAIMRNREIAAPANSKRLDKKTPCKKVGYCMDCNSPERICNKYTIIKKEYQKDRMYVIIVNQYLGY
ncbi:protein of unknown function DUF162 [Gottschalkia purinilytica]|uniref:LUD domain-containing protein n=1 Tax=Gottschalkia purinilytica TaxID=1503 RepID=A0A0L0W8W4_GOTPU|nr:lactate utilization protein [Gottschalkia purinilytica]KNF07969.1 protein of unknown function DUF162 [Gottschalkia purinilytica]